MRGKGSFPMLIMGLLILLVTSVVLGSALGNVTIDFITVCKIIIHKISHGMLIEQTWDDTYTTIIWELRIPRVLLGAIVGAGLSISGVLMQTLTRNPVADPYLLGISSGASAGAVFVIVVGASIGVGVLSIATGAFIGSLLSGILVFMIGTGGGRRSSTTQLVLAGIAVSTIFSALTNFLIYSAKNPQQGNSAIFWMMGSLGGASWKNLFVPFLLCLLIIIVIFLFSRSLDVIGMGDEAAIVLGIHPARIKGLFLLLATLLTSALVAVSGTIGFVGLIVPHVVRKFVGSNHRRVLITSSLIGAIFLIFADLCARSLVPPREIPIGIFTALMGGPFFLYLMKKGSYSFGGKG